MRILPPSRPPLVDESGMTLVELVVTMSILSIVLLVFTTTLMGLQRAQVAEEERIELNDQARLALQSIDRLVRSGNILYRPEDETGNDPYDPTATGYLFRIYTQAKFNPDDSPRCYLWVVDDQQQLLERWWPALDPTSATGWRTIAEGVVNREEAIPAFDLASDDTSRTVVVTFRVNTDFENDPGATKQVQAALTGRNTSFGYPTNTCDDLPADMAI